MPMAVFEGWGGDGVKGKVAMALEGWGADGA